MKLVVQYSGSPVLAQYTRDRLKVHKSQINYGTVRLAHPIVTYYCATVDLSHLGSGVDPQNMAKSEGRYSIPGVAAHPGNYGMRNIANAIFSVARNIIN